MDASKTEIAMWDSIKSDINIQENNYIYIYIYIYIKMQSDPSLVTRQLLF